MTATRSLGVFLRRNVWMIFALAYLGLAAWPGSFWMDPGKTQIQDTEAGQEVVLHYNGGPIREFRGGYTVIMREFSSGEVVCEAGGGPFRYVPDRTYPERITLEWWAPSDPRCHRPPVGSYTLETCWEVYGIFWGLVPPKRVCAPVEDFAILERKG